MIEFDSPFRIAVFWKRICDEIDYIMGNAGHMLSDSSSMEHVSLSIGDSNGLVEVTRLGELDL